MWKNLSHKARRVYSQSGEEGILETLFESVGTTNKCLVDIGAGDGTALSNTRLFLEHGWHGARFDANYAKDVNQERIDAENVCDILAKYNVPGEFDLLSLDVDGIDWWILRALLRQYSPRVVVCEVNPTLPEYPPVVIEYNPNHRFDECNYFGGSLSAFVRLMEAKHYTCVWVHESFNAFFVRKDLLPEGWTTPLQFAPRASWGLDPQARPWHLVVDEDVR